MNDKPKRGGAREGAGAPKKAETVVKTYRCRPDEVERVKTAIKKEIARIRRGTPKPPFSA